MEIKILFQNSIYLLITRITKLSIGFIRTKIIALSLGIYGTGIMAQLVQLTEIMARFTVSNMNDGLVKQIAESDKDDKSFKSKLPVFIKTYLITISQAILIVTTLALVFSGKFTEVFFGNIKYLNLYLIGLAAFPILVLNGVSYAILRSFKQIKFIARSELLVLVINIIIFIPLIFLWGLYGAAIYVVLAYISVLAANLYYARRVVLKKYDITIKDILKARISKTARKEVHSFAWFGLTGGVALIIADAASRALVVSKLGIGAIGLYSPVIVWASLFIGFIMPSIDTYLYPRYCECKSDGELSKIMNDSLRFVTLIMIPLILLSIPIRYKIIPLIYSRQFSLAGTFLPWHLLGTVFYIWMSIFEQAMKPAGKIKTCAVVVVIMCLIDVTIVYLLTPYFGLYAFMLKHAVSPILIFSFYIVYWKRNANFKIERKNITMMAYFVLSILLLLGAEKYIMASYKINVVMGLLLTCISWLLLSKSEREEFLKNNKVSVVINYCESRIKKVKSAVRIPYL